MCAAISASWCSARPSRATYASPKRRRTLLVFGTTIPRNVRIAEAPSHGLPVLIYDNACAGAQAYILLASEFIRRRRQVAEQVQQHEPVS